MRCHVQLIIVTIVTILLFELVSAEIAIEDAKGDLRIICKGKNYVQYGSIVQKCPLLLTDGAHGFYECTHNNGSAPDVKDKIYLYVNKCKNCVTLDIGGSSGVLIASISFTIFIGIAVYSVSAPGRSWSHQASDRHPLMRNDAAEAIYSHLDNAGKSTYSELGRRR
ncbi:T-cell surface glycoprotein CD3 delta chain-like isoform X4 [Carcharodon carcharias]|uniref:T-cell surface glycoprotein CD3 delta chain-like isoform X4 n=1 Tax=Carcharodon carcharias TaxID=13397 RepID=UPI001B7E1009|nr:T-cell surface glycoprotein CD3 delta chain-like isoform X4 [Carcharodon carcharias]XP_041029992.1 T-cell surface glycoprotein CD3 delta chain-like isoform X4 [Carcharodon carcharias]